MQATSPNPSPSVHAQPSILYVVHVPANACGVCYRIQILSFTNQFQTAELESFQKHVTLWITTRLKHQSSNTAIRIPPDQDILENVFILVLSARYYSSLIKC